MAPAPKKAKVPAKKAKTDQKKADAKQKLIGKVAQKATQKVVQSKKVVASAGVVEHKREVGKLNDCCQFCNNRLVLEAVKGGNVAEVKKLFADHDNITNPYQGFNFTNTDDNTLRAIAQSKNIELIKLVVKDFQSKKQRKRLESTLLSKFDTGNATRYNFHFQIKEINQARGSKEGNDAFIYDSKIRTYPNPRKLLKDNLISFEFIKTFIEGFDEVKKKKEKYYWLQDRVCEYVRAGMIQEAKYLIQFDFDNDMTEFNKLYIAALNNELPDRMLRVSISKQSYTHNLLSPLHCACINPNPNILKHMLKICPTFSLPDKQRRNLIHYAAANQNSDVIKFLLANGCDANELDAQRRTPMMIAADLGRLENVVALIEHFAKRSKKKIEESDEDMDEDGDNEGGVLFNVDYVNFKDKSSRTALQYAAYKGYLEIVTVLIDAGAEVDTKNSKQITPVLNSAARGHLEVLKYLHERGANLAGKINKQRKSALILASANGHSHIVEYLLRNNLSSVKEADTSGNTALHYAAAYGWPQIVKQLITAGGDPNQQNLWNTTPASLAIQKCHYQILDIILNHAPIIPGAKDENGKEQAFLSDSQGRDLVSQHLLSFDKNTVDHFRTLSQLFKRLKIEPKNSTDNSGLNAYHYLASFNPQDIAETLANKDDDTDSEDEDKKEDNVDDIDYQDDYDYDEDEMPRPRKKASKKALKKSQDVKMKDGEEEELSKEQKKIVAKYELVGKQIVEIAETLHKWGYDWTAKAMDGSTPVIIAAQCLNLPLLQWLLNRFAPLTGLQEKEKKNFLHHLFHLIIEYNVRDNFDTEAFLAMIQRKYSHNDDLFALAQQHDETGCTPLLLTLSYTLGLVYRNESPCSDSVDIGEKWMVQRIRQIFLFLQKIGHKFDEVIPQERDLKHHGFGDYRKQQEHNCERNYNVKKNQYLKAFNIKISAEDVKFNDEFGIIEMRTPMERETNFYNMFNWIHFLSQIISLLGTDTDVTPLIDLIKDFQKPQAREKMRQQLLAQTQLMETPLTNSHLFEPLFRELLKFLQPKDYKQVITGLFREGSVSIIHLTVFIRSREGVDEVIQLIEKDKSLLLQKDSRGNTLLNYASYMKNFHLVESILTQFGGFIFKTEADTHENLKGNTPLHLAILQMRSNQLELPRVEQQLIQKSKGASLIMHKNINGLNPLFLALYRGSKCSNDPINVIKLMLNTAFGQKLIVERDKLGNLPLHIAAKLDQVPLSLSLIYQKTPEPLRNSQNSFGNTPLSEAILEGETSSALFILQACSDSGALQQMVTNYSTPKVEGVVTEEIHQAAKDSVDNYITTDKQNIHRLALKMNFFGLYHFSDPNQPLPILTGAIQAKNFVLFSQLCDNYSASQLKDKNPLDGTNLLHALASTYVKSPTENSEILKKDKKKDDDEEEEYDQEDDEEEEVVQKGGNQIQGEDYVEMFKGIFNHLVEKVGIKIDLEDNLGQTVLHYAAKAKNVLFFELYFNHIARLDKSKITEFFNIKDKERRSTFFADILSIRVGMRDVVKIKLVKMIRQLIGPKILHINLDYCLKKQDVVLQAKQQANIFDKTLRERIYLSHPVLKLKAQWSTELSALFDVIESSSNRLMALLKQIGFSFQVSDDASQTTPFLWACYTRDQTIVYDLIEDGKYKLAKKEIERGVEICSKPQYLDGTISYSSNIIEYLIVKKFVDQSVSKSIKYYQEKVFKGAVYNPKIHQDRVDQEFQKALAHFNGLSKQPVQKPNLIDNVSEMQDTHQIARVANWNATEMSVLLMKVDIKRGSLFGIMRYYVLQLLEEKKNGYLTLWTRWGRLGERGQNQKTPFRLDTQAANKEFEKLIKQKTGLLWNSVIAIGEADQVPYMADKYRIVMLGNRNADKRVMSAYQSFNRALNINTIIKTLEGDLEKSPSTSVTEDTLLKNSIVDVMKRMMGKTSNSNLYRRHDENNRIMNMALTTDQISEAYMTLEMMLDMVAELKVLKKAKKEVEVKALYEKMIDLNNAYYSLIPNQDYSYSSAKELSNEYTIKAEIESLQELYDFSRTFKISMGALINKSPLSYIKDTLPIKLHKLDAKKNKSIHDLLMLYINQSMSKQENDFVVSNIFSLTDDDLHREAQDQEVFGKLHNHWMLWHGTKNENIMSILLKGLKIKPPNANHHGSLFGDAIYFSDQFIKSVDYTSRPSKWQKKGGNTFYMLLCEVALGNIANYASNWETDAYRPPVGYHSIRVMSKEGPNFDQSIMTPDYQVYPIGRVVKYLKPEFEKGSKTQSTKQFFADFLKQKKEEEKKQAKKKEVKMVVLNEDGEEDYDKDVDEEEEIDMDVRKQLEESFMKITDRKYQIKPNLLNAEYCQKRLAREDADSFDEDSIYTDISQYMVYSEKQVRIRYMVELKML